MEDSLKILMTADTVGGVWTYAMELCAALQEYNTEVHLVTMGALINKDQYATLQELKNIHLYESNYKLEWMQDPWTDVEKAMEWITSIYYKVQPDVMHFNNFGQVDGPWNCPVITVYHSCVETWWQAVKGENIPAEWHQYNKKLRAAIAASDSIVAPSGSMKARAEAILGTFKNGEVIYNGCSSITDQPLDKQHYVLSAGRVWDEGKNVRLLSEIAKDLHWPVYIAGNNESPDGEKYEPENVKFVGQLSASKMQDCMGKASIFVMPAKYEPFGLAVLEAANAKCALALSNIDTFREIWGDSALYFDPDNEQEAKKVIQSLLEDEELRRAMASKSYERAKAFTSEVMAERYIKLYQKLITNKKPKELTNRPI